MSPGRWAGVRGPRGSAFVFGRAVSSRPAPHDSQDAPPLSEGAAPVCSGDTRSRRRGRQALAARVQGSAGLRQAPKSMSRLPLRASYFMAEQVS